MPLIIVHRDPLQVIVADRAPPTGIVISADPRDVNTDADPLARAVYLGGIYGYRSRAASPAELKKKAMMVPPDPWMLAIGAIVWEGILQGLSWDLVKASAMAGLRLLRRHDLAPKERKAATSRSTRRTRSLTFRWEILGAGGRPLSTFLLCLKEAAEEDTYPERLQAVRPAEWQQLREERRRLEMTPPRRVHHK